MRVSSDDSEDRSKGPERYVAYLRSMRVALSTKAERYLAYSRLMRQGKGISKLLSNSRMLKRSADIGDAVRPISLPTVFYSLTNAITATYVLYEVYHASSTIYTRTGSVKAAGIAGVRTFVFECTASVLLPSALIHIVVHSAQNFLSRHRTIGNTLFNRSTASTHVLHNKLVTRFPVYVPSILGLLCVPLLPMIIDPPVEAIVDRIFDKAFSHMDNQT